MTANLNEPIKEKVLSTYEQIVRSSWIEGKVEGDDERAIIVIKNLAEKDFSLEDIVEISGKSEAFVREVLQMEDLMTT